MLLGSWVQPGAAKHILDIGTGTGVIALMVAQKASPGAVVVAIDNDAAAVRQAAANAGGSAWAPQLHVRLVSVQRMASSGSSGHDNGPGNNLSAPDSSTVVHAAGARTYGCFDLIVSNPPYFVSGTLSAKLASARHAGVSLPFGELAAAAASLLTQAGRLVLILPTAEAEVFDRAACIAGLTLVHILEVYTKSSDAKEKRRIHTYQHARSPTTPAADTSASTSKTHSGSSINSSVDASDQEQQQQEQRFSSALQGVRSDCDNPLDLPSSASQQQQQQQQLGSVIVQTPGRERLTIWELQPDSAPGQQFAYSDQYRAQTADFHHPDYM
ncbi:MAG: hypothetical protein WDW38_011320 [Sanguina aurantia]